VAAVIVAIYTLLMSLLYWSVIAWLSSGAVMPTEDVLFFFTFSGTLMAVILASLHVVRFCGYRFTVWRRPQPVVQSECPFADEDD
jgi:hypothetical protein